MNYDFEKRPNHIFLGVESSFTLIDFILFFFSFILGFIFALFFLIFAVAVLQKIFSRYEFEFNTDDYTITRYYRFFSYFRFKREKIGFGEVDEILLSNFESGKALFTRGMKSKEWFTLDIRTKNGYMRLIKTEEDELEELYELYELLEEKLELYFSFRMEFLGDGESDF
ncbi:hypothetical protein [Gracilimonas mengyeensis]|uniref:Uncharacterized protein n=1 Tax=Gracilimonas mengyeensis TaxID=1302730 RepID=A0A521EU64_9BACT|nr:hypothetical protein [Gracilimonas mengyeensis]SMO87437.1 hypothetical protein SAMN06265219_113159 [Gracilimonas mengyeensis]